MLVLLILCLAYFADAAEKVPFVEPQYLDQLLAEERYDEFSYYLGIPDPSLSRPSNAERSLGENPMFHRDLVEGDLVVGSNLPEEEARQGINFTMWGGSRWLNNQGEPAHVPVYIASNFTQQERDIVVRGLAYWNKYIASVKIVYYNNHRDYVYIYPGSGCWSQLGRRGNQQSMSLQQNGCLYQGTVVHEMIHAIGTTHEQNRQDRDEYIEMIWENIPSDWRGQYQKCTDDVYQLLGYYDYYSIMHYEVNAPDSGKPAFRVRQSGINENVIGRGNEFTADDIYKVDLMYKN